MARYGPSIEREQILLADFVDIGTELFAIAATCSRAQSKINSGVSAKEIIPLADFFCTEARGRICRSFHHLSRNNNRDGYRLARAVLDGKYPWLEEGIVRWDPSERASE
jgi:hypothetical protein